jgi:two-component system cell cycle response regulator
MPVEDQTTHGDAPQANPSPQPDAGSTPAGVEVDFPLESGVTRISVRKLPEAIDGIGDECLVVLYGGSIGRKYDLYSDEILIGRDPSNHIAIEVDSVSRNHARIVMDGDRRFVEDLGSTNGTYVADHPVTRGVLRSGDLLRVGDVIFKYLAGQDIEAAYHEEIYRMTISDGLTSIANLRYLQEFLERELARSRRYGRELSVILLDIDHFKAVNDSLGHLCGDFVLRELCQLLARRVRREELLARYGGEELLLALPETTEEGAAVYAERLRAMVEAHRFVFEGHTVAVTVSMGVAGFEPNMARPMDLIRVADERLYRAKRAGRNRVVV